VSFYKMFGYPTGLGALIARSRTLERLQRPWFSGGTVVAANVQGDLAMPHAGHAGFEDGTVDYLGIPAVEIGLRHIERIGIDTIAQRVASLGSWLLDAMQRLEHSDGSPAVRVYGPATWDRRGSTIAFNFLHPTGAWSTNALSTWSRRSTTSPSGRAASATRAPARSRSRSRTSGSRSASRRA
jgi:molybdenum cofactor sulfurtransferase